MAIEEFRPGAARPKPTGSIALIAPQRRRLAIVSTRNRMCGIAAYTHALEQQLADLFEIRVFDLDQYFLRSTHPRLRALGDRHIDEICRSLADFDAVNLQLEFGTLGRSAKDIYRRFSRLVRAAPHLSVTFHTLKRPPAYPLADFAKAVIKFRWRTGISIRTAYKRDTTLSHGIARRLRRAQRRKPVSVIVHNRLDLAEARHLYDLEHVFDHPLAFLSADHADEVNHQATRRRFPLLDRLPDKTCLVGVFGFLNNYKGFGSVIRALYHLSADHHLLIFGGTHPNEIQSHQPIHPYVASLLQDGHIDATLYDQILASPTKGVNLALDIERHLTDLVSAHPRDLSERIHFMGALDDAEFLTGMAICDAVVFPYLEVGQSASGPISQALELGCRIIASRTHTFLQFAAYHPNRIEFFDIGNHLELAARIAARPQYARREAPVFDVETNKAVYLAANSPPPTLRFHPSRTAARADGRRATGAV